MERWLRLGHTGHTPLALPPIWVVCRARADNERIRSMQTIVYRLLLASLSLLVVMPAVSAPASAGSNPEAEKMAHAFLRREAVRLDARFLEGVTNRVQWEAQREERRREYLEMLGLWPMPERSPLQAEITGVLD